jgi:hypothetical protein
VRCETVRNWRHLVIGLLLMLPLTMTFTGAQINRMRGVDWDAYKPTAWLIADIERDPVGSAAWSEFLRRLNNEALDSKAIDRVIEAALAGLPNRPTERAARLSPYGRFLDRAIEQDTLDQNQLLQYLDGWYVRDPNIFVRSRIRQGGRIELSIWYEGEDAPGLVSRHALVEVRLGDGEPLTLDNTPGVVRNTLPFVIRNKVSAIVDIDGEVGTTELIAVIDSAYGVRSSPLGGPPLPTPPDTWPEALHAQRREFRIPVEIVAEDVTPVELVYAAATENDVTPLAVMRPVRVTATPGAGVLRLTTELEFIAAPPMPLCYRVFVQLGDHRVQTGWFSHRARTSSSYETLRGEMHSPPPDIAELTVATVILEPAPDLIEWTTDIEEILGDTLVLENVPLVWIE